MNHCFDWSLHTHHKIFLADIVVIFIINICTLPGDFYSIAISLFL